MPDQHTTPQDHDADPERHDHPPAVDPEHRWEPIDQPGQPDEDDQRAGDPAEGALADPMAPGRSVFETDEDAVEPNEPA